MSFKRFDRIEDTLGVGPDSAIPGPATYGEDLIPPYAVMLTARCRKCQPCRKYKARSWTVRARTEITTATRTWMWTLTLSPAWHEHFANHARMRADRRKLGQFETLSPEQQLHMRHVEIQRQLTLIFKRMRAAGMVFRYIIVLEAHESGLPHYHLLIHEIGAPIRYADLVKFWPFGFQQAKLVDDAAKGAWYVAKYISKSQAARVRASLHYGSIKRPSATLSNSDSVKEGGAKQGET